VEDLEMGPSSREDVAVAQCGDGHRGKVLPIEGAGTGADGVAGRDDPSPVDDALVDGGAVVLRRR
jgi:hypothetical protein